MVGRARGTFVDEVPEMQIEGGIVHIVSEGGHFYMRPSVVRNYINTAKRLLDKFDAEQRCAVPFPERETG